MSEDRDSIAEQLRAEAARIRREEAKRLAVIDAANEAADAVLDDDSPA